MEALPVNVVLLFAASIVIQVAGAAIWPLTRGFTRPWPTLMAVVAQTIGIVLFNLVIASGVKLSTLTPLAGAMVPLVSVLVGVLIYKERAGFRKLSMLLAACGLIGVASLF